MRARRYARILGDSILAIAAAAFALLAAGRVAGIETVAGLPFPALVLALAAAAVTAGIVIVSARAGSLIATARHAEARTDLAERLSSALEVLRDRKRHAGPVATALIRDAGEKGQAVEIGTVAPLAGRSTAIAAAALAAAVVAYLVVPPGGTEIDTPATIAAETAPDDGSATNLADDIGRMADLIAADAERLDEDYLRAVANSLRELAREAESLTPDDLAERFSALVEHASLGYGEDAPEWLPADARALAELGARMDAFEAAAAEQAARPAPPGGNLEAFAQIPINDDYGSDVRREQPLFPREAPPEAGDGALETAGEEIAELGAAGGGSIRLEPMQQPDLVPAGAMPVGAARESGRGASRIAGGGTRELAESTEYLTAEFARGEQVVIAAEATGSGNRIRIQADPEAALSEVADDAIAGAGSWEAGAAAPVTREAVGPSERAVVARYFARTPQPAP